MKTFKLAFLAAWACFALNFAVAQTPGAKLAQVVLHNNTNSITLKHDTLKKLYALKHLSIENMIKVNCDIPDMSDLLLDAGIITDKKNFTALLTNKELKVNGELQPEKVHQEILKKFQKKADDTVNFSFTYAARSKK